MLLNPVGKVNDGGIEALCQPALIVAAPAGAGGSSALRL